MAPEEVASLGIMNGAPLSTNPDTGLPEAGGLLPVLGSLAGAFLTGGQSLWMQAAASGLGSFAGSQLQGDSLKEGLMTGLMSAGTTGLLGGMSKLGGATSIGTDAATTGAENLISQEALLGGGDALDVYGLTAPPDVLGSASTKLDFGLGDLEGVSGMNPNYALGHPNTTWTFNPDMSLATQPPVSYTPGGARIPGLMGNVDPDPSGLGSFGRNPTQLASATSNANAGYFEKIGLGADARDGGVSGYGNLAWDAAKANPAFPIMAGVGLMGGGYGLNSTPGYAPPEKKKAAWVEEQFPKEREVLAPWDTNDDYQAERLRGLEQDYFNPVFSGRNYAEGGIVGYANGGMFGQSDQDEKDQSVVDMAIGKGTAYATDPTNIPGVISSFSDNPYAGPVAGIVSAGMDKGLNDEDPSFATIGSIAGGAVNAATNMSGFGILGTGIGTAVDQHMAEQDLEAMGLTPEQAEISGVKAFAGSFNPFSDAWSVGTQKDEAFNRAANQTYTNFNKDMGLPPAQFTDKELAVPTPPGPTIANATANWQDPDVVFGELTDEEKSKSQTMANAVAMGFTDLSPDDLDAAQDQADADAAAAAATAATADAVAAAEAEAQATGGMDGGGGTPTGPGPSGDGPSDDGNTASPGGDEYGTPFAEGGVVGPSQEQAPADPVVQGAIAAIMGQHPEPQQAIQTFIQVYGPKDFAALREQVIASQSSDQRDMSGIGGMIEGPGTGTSDDIPGQIMQDGQPVEEIRVSDGEYIVPEQVGDENPKLMAVLEQKRQAMAGENNAPRAA